MNKVLEHLISTITQMQHEEQKTEEDVIKVSETVSVAASVYETIRNTLEYDEEHLLRRNAIKRILKRRLADEDKKLLAEKLLKELIWAKYLPNKKIPTSKIEVVADILEKYKPIFEGLEEESKEDQETYVWLLDVISTELEYRLGPPCSDEALASYAYQELKKRITWQTNVIAEKDQELQLYIAVHRTVLKSNTATLRYRLLTLYYPDWRKAKAGDSVVKEIHMNLPKVIKSVEDQIFHSGSDAIHRFVRRHAIVFRLLADIAEDNPQAFQQAVAVGDKPTLDSAITEAARVRYKAHRVRLRRTVVRAAFFLLLTKSILAVLVEYPYELFVLHTTDYFPLLVNILFPPLLLAVIGLTVRIAKKKNNKHILDEVHGLLGISDDFALVFKRKRAFRGPMFFIFNLLYLVVFLVTIGLVIQALLYINFNALSIFFFIFFLSLVAYFGLRIRNTRRELVVLDSSRGFFGTISDILFVPLVRVGRWISIRAPKINIFLFFFDFIIEAPFKASIEITESWLAFLREKREEI